MKILLACSSGMSTSLLVSKMREAAENTGLDCEIWAVSQDKAEEEMQKADVLLIGPQMRFLKSKFKGKAKEIGIPLDVIEPMAYGRCDGKAVLNKAVQLVNES
ncbi:PTS sugar transporter subunit IIB [Aneurinibacillus terranovensis]|uniref:PTS sugar transporter subunit IIB n=1 Tax=Aneurinibacillus terranovensis TaxID=278991 RepID=UPI000404FEAE|nr:PTS sugar transporter subunit IIB [Aneurinibacillus terranovensis]